MIWGEKSFLPLRTPPQVSLHLLSPGATFQLVPLTSARHAVALSSDAHKVFPNTCDDDDDDDGECWKLSRRRRQEALNHLTHRTSWRARPLAADGRASTQAGRPVRLFISPFLYAPSSSFSSLARSPNPESFSSFLAARADLIVE